MHASLGRHSGWFVLSLVVFGAQIALGTAIDFAAASLCIFLLFPVVWQLYASIDNVGGQLLVTTFGKLFLVSQVIKIGLGQAADSNLDAPLETALVLLAGMGGFLLAGLILVQILPLVPLRLMSPRHDPEFMRRIGLAAMALSALGSAWGWNIVLVDGPTMGSEAPTGNALWMYLIMLLPFSAAVFTARSMLMSDGTRTVDRYVLATLSVGIVLGVWGNSRTTLLTGFAAYYLTYLSYGGRIKSRHVAVALAVATLTQVFFFPLIDLQRQLPRPMPVREYLIETAALAVEVLRGEHMSTQEGNILQNVYDLWSTRHYYGDSIGFLERFTPSQVDEAVYAIPEDKILGADNLLSPFLRVIPRRLAPLLGIDYPAGALETIEYEIWRSPYYTALNYGLFVEVYTAIGMKFMTIVVGFYLILFFLSCHVVYGGVQRNYMGAFCTSIFLFTIADSEMGELVARIVGQGGLFVALYAIANRVWTITHRP